MFLRIFCQIAAALQEQGDAARAPGGIWEQVRLAKYKKSVIYLSFMCSPEMLRALLGIAKQHLCCVPAEPVMEAKLHPALLAILEPQVVMPCSPQ
jgi:hypothetical protein